MKRSIFAIAVAGALTLGAAQAETVLYGSIRFDYSAEKQFYTQPEVNQFGQVTQRVKSERVSNLNDVGSRIGLKGGETLGNGVQVVYQLEWGFDGMEGLQSSNDGFRNRLAYIGLQGDFGLFAIGRQDNPFKVMLVDNSVTDEFNVTSDSSAMNAVVEAFGFSGRLHASSGILDRVGNSIAYVSPDWNGFQFNVAVVMDDDLKAGRDEKGRLSGNYEGWDEAYWTTYQRYGWDSAGNITLVGDAFTNAEGLKQKWGAYNSIGLDHKKHLDLWTINAQYFHDSGFYVKGGYIQGNTRSDEKSKAWGLHVGYTTDQFGLSAAYADGNYKANQSDWFTNSRWKSDTKGFDVGARIAFGANYDSSVRVKYGQYEVKDRYTDTGYDLSTGFVGLGDDHSFKRKYKTWAVGFEQKLSSRTRVWAEYANVKPTYTENNRVNLGSIAFPKSKPKTEDRFSLGIRHDF